MPILAQNCRLQVQRVIVMESACDPLVFALRSLRFLSASQILFSSQRAAPLLMRPRHFDRICAVCSQDAICISKSSREALRASL